MFFLTGLRRLALAVQYFTRIPIRGRLADLVGFDPQLAAGSIAHWPAIGWLVGGVGTAVFCALLALLPPGPLACVVAAVFSTMATILLTGALHEDGLADVADGLGGSSAPRAALAIMKDSRIGAFGALALMMVPLGKVALLALLADHQPSSVICALILGHVLSRTAPLTLVFALPYAGAESTSKAAAFFSRFRLGELAVAAAWAAPPALAIGVLYGPRQVLFALIGCAAVATYLARTFRRRLNGVTGDCLGACQQLTELACYLAVAFAP